jgi:lysophospholipase L1-like esterase
MLDLKIIRKVNKFISIIGKVRVTQYMKRIFLMLALLCTPLSGQMVTVSGHLANSKGVPAVGTVIFQPALSTGQAISYQGPSAQITARPVSAKIASGYFSITLPDTSLTNPKNVCFNLKAVETGTGYALLGKGYECVQPHYTATGLTDWCQAGVCNLDNYIPNLPALGTIETGPPGPANSLAIGTVSTLDAGSTATAIITGASPSQTLSLGIPKGDKGDIGPQGASAITGMSGDGTGNATLTGKFTADTVAAVTSVSAGGTTHTSIGSSGVTFPDGTVQVSAITSSTATNINGTSCALNGSCTIAFPGQFITSNLLAHWNMVQGSVAQKVYNVAYTGFRTNFALSSDDFTTWQAYNGGTGGVNTVTFTGASSNIIGHNKVLSGVSNFPNVASSAYTISAMMSVASGTGTARLGFYTSGRMILSSDFALTTTPTLFSFTWTGTSTIGISAIIQNGTAGTAQTIVVKSLRVNQGASDLGSETMPVNDMWLGEGTGTESTYDPLWSSTGLNFAGLSGSGGTYNLITIPYVLTSANISFYALFRITGNAAVSEMATLAGGLNTPYFNASSGTSSPFPTFTGCGTTSAPGVNVNDGKYHVLTLTYTGTLATFYLDGVLMQTAVTCAGSFPFRVIGAGGLVNGFPGEIDDVLFYSTVHTPAQVAWNTDAMWREISGRTFPPIQPSIISRLLVIDGDSISVGKTLSSWAQSYAYLAANQFSPFIQHSLQGIAGKTCAQQAASAATDVDPFLAKSANSVLFVFCGTNDVSYGGGGIVGYNNLKAYVTARHAAGWKNVAVATLLPFGQYNGCTSNNAQRAIFNNLVRGDKAGADVLIDWAADPLIGPDSACSSAATTYSSDGTHPNAAGSAIMSQYFAPGLASLLGTTVTLPAPTFSPVSPYSGAAASVAISDSQSVATILYCQDTDNTCTPSTAYTSAISVSATGYIRAQATMSGWTSSSVASWAGTIE